MQHQHCTRTDKTSCRPGRERYSSTSTPMQISFKPVTPAQPTNKIKQTYSKDGDRPHVSARRAGRACSACTACQRSLSTPQQLPLSPHPLGNAATPPPRAGGDAAPSALRAGRGAERAADGEEGRGGEKKEKKVMNENKGFFFSSPFCRGRAEPEVGAASGGRTSRHLKRQRTAERPL